MRNKKESGRSDHSLLIVRDIFAGIAWAGIAPVGTGTGCTHNLVGQT